MKYSNSINKNLRFVIEIIIIELEKKYSSQTFLYVYFANSLV